jgi:hypothetical protein
MRNAIKGLKKLGCELVYRNNSERLEVSIPSLYMDLLAFESLRKCISNLEVNVLDLYVDTKWNNKSPEPLDCKKLEIVFSILQDNRSIDTLILKDCIGGRNSVYANVEMIAEFLATNSSLKSLDLSNNGLKDSDLASIAYALRDKNTSLQSLNLSGNKVGAGIIVAISCVTPSSFKLSGVEISSLLRNTYLESSNTYLESSNTFLKAAIRDIEKNFIFEYSLDKPSNVEDTTIYHFADDPADALKQYDYFSCDA